MSLQLVFVLLQTSIADDIHGLQSVLDQLYTDMIPLCSGLIGVGRGIAGFAAIWYIAARVWKHLANAEPIDFYPLFRPFVLGFCVLIFPSVIAMINGLLQPTVSGTGSLVTGSDKAIAALLKQKEEAVKNTVAWQLYVGPGGEGDRDKWYEYTYNEDPSQEGWIAGVGNSVNFAMSKFYYNFKNSIKAFLSEVLKVLYEAAALCINTIRTFNMIVMAILGPLVFGISVFDGFQHTLRQWLARYINLFLWLPVANIFGAIMGKIQENMLKLDIAQLQDQGNTFFSPTDMGYLIFMIIGIAGYFTVPSVANYIVHAGGQGALLQRVNMGFQTVQRTTANSANSAIGTATGWAGNAATAVSSAIGSSSPHSSGNTGSGYMQNKISGNH